jgi:hypothetical protein
MRERRNPVERAARIVFCVLAGFLAAELVRAVIWFNPFRGAVIPELPVLASNETKSAGGLKGTNAATASTNAGGKVVVRGTNLLGSNSAAAPLPHGGTNFSGTNLIAGAVLEAGGTNAALSISNVIAAAGVSASNAPASNAPASNAPASNAPASNAIASLSAASGTGAVARVVQEFPATNSAVVAGSNRPAVAAVSSNAPARTNAAGVRLAGGPPVVGAGPNGLPGQAPGRGGANLSPALQARIRKITESELLAPVIHPLPKALLGIAGDCAFLRADSGQTGLVKEGDSLDDIKLLRIGVNRVLIEQGGQKKELMIFSGYGGDSLLPTDSTNETNHVQLP